MKLYVRWTLIIGLLGLIWGTHIITTTSSFLTSQKVLRIHAGDIMENIAELAMEQSHRHLLHAHGAASLTKRLLTSKVVGSEYTHMTALERYFYNQLAINPHLAGIYVGTPEGGFYDVRRHNGRSEKGFRTKIISINNGHRETRLIWRDKAFNKISEETVADDTYDPRIRPWYKKALSENRIVWTDPYVFFTSKKPGITIAGPFYDDNRQIIGIVGVDIEIDQLSTFIGNLKIGKNGRAFMLNRNGDVVAFPDLSKLSKTHENGKGSYRLVKIDELDDTLSRQAFFSADFKKDEKGMIIIDTPKFARFEYNGKVYHAMFRPFSTSQWPWIIGVHLPEDDYLGTIKSNRVFNLFVTLAISIFATVLGFFLAKGIIRPLFMLEQESRAIKNNDFGSNIKINSMYKEFQETADSFSEMKNTVRISQKKYMGIFENIQDIYYEATLDGKILEISPSAEKTSSYTRDELLKMSIYDLYAEPSDRDKLVDKMIRFGRIDDDEVLLIDKKGEHKYCSLNAEMLRDTNGNPIKIIGSLRNITGRKKAEKKLIEYRDQLEDLVNQRTQKLEKSNSLLIREIKQRRKTEKALRENEEKYRTILDSIKEGYFEVDLAGNILFVNDAVFDITGFTLDELKGKPYNEIIVTEHMESVSEAFMKMYRTGRGVDLSGIPIFTKNRDNRIVDLKASVMKSRNGATIGFRGVARDQTAKVEANKEKQKLSEQLSHAQRMEAVGTLAGGIAHDFNNLLMGIQGNTSLLSMKLGKNNDLRNNLKTIEKCVESGATLTRQLLGYARGGKYMVEQIDLNDTVKRTTDLFGRTKKEIRIHTMLQDKIWGVEADRGQIDQVLVNIYVNAWQAMEQDLDLFIETQNTVLDDKFTHPFGVPSGRYAKISIRDTGKGMDKQVVKRIFEPFFTTKQIGSGTGLGLASAFGIIKNHNGIIDVISTPGKGSTFIIYLPVSEKTQKTEPVKQIPKASAPTASSSTVLVVDDEPYIFNSVRALLEDLDYKVITAEGGEKALDLFHEHQDEIDIVLLDMIMPDISGERVLELMKQVDPSLSVIISSGYSITTFSDFLNDYKNISFIQKPYDMSGLTDLIRSSLLNKT